MFIFYYKYDAVIKYDLVIIYWWPEKYYMKFIYHAINSKPVWNNMYVVR